MKPMDTTRTAAVPIHPKPLNYDYTAGYALALRKEELAELSQLLGRNIADVDDLLLAARNVTTLSVKGLEGGDITLEPYLLNRLMSRCHTGDFPGFLRDRIKELLAGYCGA